MPQYTDEVEKNFDAILPSFAPTFLKADSYNADGFRFISYTCRLAELWNFHIRVQIDLGKKCFTVELIGAHGNIMPNLAAGVLSLTTIQLRMNTPVRVRLPQLYYGRDYWWGSGKSVPGELANRSDAFIDALAAGKAKDESWDGFSRRLSEMLQGQGKNGGDARQQVVQACAAVEAVGTPLFKEIARLNNLEF